MYRDLEEMHRSLAQHLVMDRGQVTALVSEEMAPGAVDAFARNAIFNPDPTIRTQLRQALRAAAAVCGIRCQPATGLLDRIEEGARGTLLVIRLGGHCYDLARLALRSAHRRRVAGLVFEQGWAGQSPWEFSALLAAAALREKWNAPLFLRCGLPPLASDLLPGGKDSEALADTIVTARSAELNNLVLRISTAGLLQNRSLAELQQLLRVCLENKMCVSLRLDDSGRIPPAADIASAQSALRQLATELAPHLLAVSGGSYQAAPDLAHTWLEASGARALALSGLRPMELFEATLNRPVVEVRVEFDWAERIVMHPEFMAERRREVLTWLRKSRQGGLLMTDTALLHTYEYQAMGHFEFELWDLNNMPSFREDLMAMLDRLYEAMDLVDSLDLVPIQ